LNFPQNGFYNLNNQTNADPGFPKEFILPRQIANENKSIIERKYTRMLCSFANTQRLFRNKDLEQLSNDFRAINYNRDKFMIIKILDNVRLKLESIMKNKINNKDYNTSKQLMNLIKSYKNEEINDKIQNGVFQIEVANE